MHLQVPWRLVVGKLARLEPREELDRLFPWALEALEVVAHEKLPFLGHASLQKWPPLVTFIASAPRSSSDGLYGYFSALKRYKTAGPTFFNSSRGRASSAKGLATSYRGGSAFYATSFAPGCAHDGRTVGNGY